MPTLTITKTYADGDTLFEADLDNLKDDIENMLNVTKLNDDNIQSAGITGSTKLVDASVSSAKLASGSVTTSKIADEAITDGKIQSGGLTAAGLATDSVTTAKILASNVTTAKIADGAVTQAKRADLGQQVSSSSGSFTTTNTTDTDVTNLTVTITTTGRPVMLMCVNDATGSSSLLAAQSASQVGGLTACSTTVRIVRDSTEIYESTLSTTVFLSSGTPGNTACSAPVSSISTIDIPSAGTYTYKVTIKAGGSYTQTSTLSNAKLVAFEL